MKNVVLTNLLNKLWWGVRNGVASMNFDTRSATPKDIMYTDMYDM